MEFLKQNPVLRVCMIVYDLVYIIWHCVVNVYNCVPMAQTYKIVVEIHKLN